MTLLPLNRLKFHKGIFHISDIFGARGLMVSVTKSHIEEGSKVSREFFFQILKLHFCSSMEETSQPYGILFQIKSENQYLVS